MGFSELEFLKDETGLEWDGERLCLYGALKEYPVFISDDPERREYLFTVFFKVRPDTEDALKKGITELLENMPKNCVLSRKDEVRCTALKFNAAPLYQENSFYLVRFLKDICSLGDKLELVPTVPDEKEREAAAPCIRAAAPKEKTREKKPKNAVIKGFDKYSVRGLFAALIGGGAMTVLGGIISAIDQSNVGGMLAGWSVGALIAAVVLADYWFLAKKIDIFGSIICCIITAAGCFISAHLGALRTLFYDVRDILDSSVTLNQTLANWSYYQVLFPDAAERFPIMLLQNYFSAILASVVFFTFYFNKHQNIMFGKRGDTLEEDEGEKKKTKKLR